MWPNVSNPGSVEIDDLPIDPSEVPPIDIEDLLEVWIDP